MVEMQRTSYERYISDQKERKNDIPTTPHMSFAYINSAEC